MIDYVNKVMRDEPLYRMFTAIPHRYDLINRLLTWGRDKRWRWQAAKQCLALHPRKVLDLGCGTGDLAISLARLSDSNVELTGIDYSQPMLERATKKAQILAKGRISFIHSYAVQLPFPDGYFDCVGISFAFRNLTYKNPRAQRHIAEVFRVLSDGGSFVILETSQPESKLIRKLYHLYLRWFVFRLGYLLSGNKGAYDYLAESAARFYTAKEVEEILLKAGFRQVSFCPLLLGAIGIHVAIK